MIRFSTLVRKIRRKIIRLRYQPIRVFCFHQVSDEFNPETTWACDWMQTDRFKQLILDLTGEYSFISLTDAYRHIANNVFRIKRYAVLTFDDGEMSIKHLLPWLREQGIPVTLFVNPAYLNGEERREKPMSLLTKMDLKELEQQYRGIISIGNHGFLHQECTDIPINEFRDSVLRSESFLAQYEAKVSFFAYPYGRHVANTDLFLTSVGLIPVLCDGQVNYNDPTVIHREVYL